MVIESPRLVIGRSGINFMDEERVEGEDPVAQYGGRSRTGPLGVVREASCGRSIERPPPTGRMRLSRDTL